MSHSLHIDSQYGGKNDDDSDEIKDNNNSSLTIENHYISLSVISRPSLAVTAKADSWGR